MPQPRRRHALRFGKKGGHDSLTLISLILLRLTKTSRVDDKFRQRAAEARMNTFGQIDAVRGAE
jgi:hypothetical protein